MSKEYLDEEAVKRIEKITQQESIDNAKPSEALEEIKTLRGFNQVELNNDENVNKSLDIIEQALLKAQKEHNSTNLLMQELDCKDFADLRKYARCGYEKLNKKYLKWEDLEFKKQQQVIDVLLNGKPYVLYFYKLSTQSEVNMFSVDMHIVTLNSYYPEDIQFFNDLHLERVE